MQHSGRTSTIAGRVRAQQAAMVVAGSMLMALGAHVSIPLPFSPVPITGQTFALAIVVALLGTRGATMALLLYLAEGVAGLPVFAPVPPFLPGLLKLFGPTGGYLIAFPLAAFVTGWLFDRGLWKSYAGRVAAIFLGSLVDFAGGAAWLSHLVGWSAAVAVGVTPFLVGDALKTLLAAGAAPWARDSGRAVPRI